MLILLDLDGTLIHDRGYRAAIDATILNYARMNDLPACAPSDDDVHLLHAHGYSNEWDSVAFLAGILHHAKWNDLSGCPDYQAWTRQTHELPGLPNERARDVLLRHTPTERHSLIHALLDHVTDVNVSVTTRMFAEMILGSQLFSEHYHLPAALHVPSLLETLDEALITSASRDIILAHRACVFTARPSLPPSHQEVTPPTDSRAGTIHPPEAEIGLRLLQLEHLPMIALGHVQWLADIHGERVYDLTKPAPVQAYAAMLAATGVTEQKALHAAYDFWRSSIVDAEYVRLHGEHVYVFEDNAAGVRACHAAARQLGEHGIHVTVHGMGIATAIAKRDALAPVCDNVFSSINDALATLNATAR